MAGKAGSVPMKPVQAYSSRCPVCGKCGNPIFATVSEVDYFRCRQCKCLFADSVLIGRIDNGDSNCSYDSAYWQEELAAARERSYGSSLARVAEVLIYARIPVKNFIDVGTGPGFLLDALAYYLPSCTRHFYGVEAYPPETRSNHPNYVKGTPGDLRVKFQAGTCIEVIEHLTPNMLTTLVSELEEVSDEQAIYIFNTGMPDYVMWQDSAYLDPHRRGHIMSYSIKSLRLIFEPHGFRVLPIAGKSWAFIAEFKSKSPGHEDVTRRIWTALPENMALLDDPKTGPLMKVLGVESIRAYYIYNRWVTNALLKVNRMRTYMKRLFKRPAKK